MYRGRLRNQGQNQLGEASSSLTSEASLSTGDKNEQQSDDESHLSYILGGGLVAILMRHLISLHPHSGMNAPPRFGDYEAQRHWMEITLHVPIRDWYRNTTQNDLEHWGLDYPPLTAYVSWLCGLVSRAFDPSSMALYTSRGYETPQHKAIMRLTVLVLDLCIYFPAVWAMASTLLSAKKKDKEGERRGPVAVGLLTLSILLQPALLLIDHGHFQYNSVCLGLALMGAVQILRGQEVLGCILFCLALNFKHIALYYATAFFFVLLHRCRSKQYPLLHIIKLGITVLSTCALLWSPFCLAPAENEESCLDGLKHAPAEDGESCLDGLKHVVERLFPLKRGLFEDKVANFWYVMSIPLDLRSILPVQYLALISLGTTLLALLPSSLDLLLRGPLHQPTSSSSSSVTVTEADRFLLGLFNSSLSFFMFSFQVHEKSLLFPLLPASFLLALEDPLLAWWLGVLGPFSMFPLLRRDGLVIAYFATLLLHSVITPSILSYLSSDENEDNSKEKQQQQKQAFSSSSSPIINSTTTFIWTPLKYSWVVVTISLMILLHLLEAYAPPPSNLPHIYPLFFSVFSAGNLGLLFLYMNARQLLFEVDR